MIFFMKTKNNVLNIRDIIWKLFLWFSLRWILTVNRFRAGTKNFSKALTEMNSKVTQYLCCTVNFAYWNDLTKDVKFQCNAPLWYSSNDMIFYYLSPIIIIPLLRCPKFGYVNWVVIYILSIISSFWVAWFNRFDGGMPVT